MNIFEVIQEICDNATIIAEASPKPQQEVIVALVEAIDKFIALSGSQKQISLEEKAANYADLLRQGHNINKLRLAELIDDLVMANQIKKMKAAA